MTLDASIKEQDDRNRLLAYMQEEGMKVSVLVHNQPFMFDPNKG